MRWLRTGLFPKFLIVMGILAILPVTYLGFYVVNKSRAGMQEAVLELHRKVAERMALEVSNYFKVNEDKLAFALASLQKDMAWTDKQELLKTLIDTHPNIIEISIINPKGGEVVKVYNPDLSSSGELVQRTEQEGFKRFSEARQKLMLLQEADRTMELYYPMGPVAAIRVLVSLRSLAEGIGEERVKGTGFCVLVGRDGRPLFYPKEKVHDKFLAEFPRLSIVSSSLQANSVGWGEFKDESGGRWVGAYAPVPVLSGAMIILQPYEEAYNAALQLRKASFLVLIAVAAIALLAATVMARRLTSPLLAISHSAEAVSRGDFLTSVDIDTGDELQDLADTFNRMTSQLRAYSVLQVDRLISEQRKTEAILYSSKDGILMLDKEGKIQLANRIARELLGVELATALEGKPAAEALPDSKLRQAVLQIYLDPKPDAYKEIDLSTKETRRFVRVGVNPVVTPGTGAVLGVVTSLRDITFEKELESMKEEFLHYITHDLRNPLGSAMGFIEVLLKGLVGVLNKDQQNMVSSIQRSMSRLMSMINNILDIAKMESGRIRLQLQPVSMPGVACRSMNILESLYQQKKIAVSMEAAEEFVIPLDPDLMERIFTNLLGNAIKYTPAGGKIVIRIEDQGSALRACVEDSGEGIPESYREKVFEKFEQVAGQRKGGTGLGLTITRFFVESHLGKIWVESEVGKGSRFMFSIPKNLTVDANGVVSVGVEAGAGGGRVRVWAAGAAVLWLLLAGPALAEESVALQSVTVRPGDTLWGIANTYLKDPKNWDQILAYNKNLGSDPSAALPGMILKVPVKLIREDLRAAKLVYRINKVLFRKKETADWQGTRDNQDVFKNDSVRTLEDSRAKVKFLNGDMLSLDPNSMAIIKPLNKDYDVELKAGGVFVGKSKVVTASAKIYPKTQDTRYSAEVKSDLSTVVRVHQGRAAVEAEGRTVDVAANMGTEVKMGMAPGVPVAFERLPEFEARAADFDEAVRVSKAQISAAPLPGMAGAAAPVIRPSGERGPAVDARNINLDLDSLRVGLPVSGFNIQFSRTPDFTDMALDKVYEADEKVDFKRDGLAAGRYWGRIAMIDLLGTKGKYSAPRVYSWGGTAAQVNAPASPASSVVLLRPATDETVSAKSYRVMGRARADNLQISVNGSPARVDEAGNFAALLSLREGINDIRVGVTNAAGENYSIIRRVTYRP